MIIFHGLHFALKRLISHLSLVAFLFAGLVIAVGLAIAVPLYADAINYNLLNAALSENAEQSRRPPFTFIFRYIGSWFEPVTVEAYAPLDRYMQDQVAGAIGLPEQGLTRFASTDNLQLFPEGASLDRGQRLDLVKLAFLSEVENHIRLVEGGLPREVSEAGAPVDVLVSLAMANRLGLHAGETYRLYLPNSGGPAPFQLKLRVSGIWLPGDPADPFWFFPPETFEKRLLVPEETFFDQVAGQLDRPVNEAAWRLDFDGRSLRSEGVASLLRRVSRVQNQVNALLPHTSLDTSPLAALRQYRQQALALTGALFVFSAPVLGLALYFLGLVAAMLVRRQRNEIAVLRSRGAGRAWVTSIYLLEWAVLSLLALSAGVWLGLFLAGWVGHTQSFLDFSRPGNLPLRITVQSLAIGLAAAGLALVFSLLPAWSAGRFTIVSYKQEQARARLRPLWQRAYLDVLLLLPAVYGWYTLRQAEKSGTWRILGRSLERSSPFENPLLFLLPALFILGASLLFVRFLPVLLSALAWLSARSRRAVPVMALRQLARSAGAHRGPAMLLVITLSLAGFTASMAQTLDRHLQDSVYYTVGADLNLTESGEVNEQAGNNPATMLSGGVLQQPSSASGPVIWNFLPVSDHLGLPGVRAAVRVGRYDAELQAGGGSASGRLFGIDRTDFPAVAFFRRDFSNEPLVALMNRLALDPAAVLIDRETWNRFNINPGDPLLLQVSVSGETRTLAVKAAGVLDYFPTHAPQAGPFFVGNLEYVFQAFGGFIPYDVWLRTAPEADTGAIVSGLQELRVAVIRVQDARAELEGAYAAPDRQGVLGLLSIGFLAAALLTVAGFLLYALLSFRERFILLGVLRAIGLSARQMAASLAMEQLILVLAGLAGGTGIAVLTALLFIPYLPVSLGQYAGALPYGISIAWGDLSRIYLIFLGMLLLGTAATVISLRRMKIFQAVKLGEVL